MMRNNAIEGSYANNPKPWVTLTGFEPINKLSISNLISREQRAK
jgi:hypothetical protein